MRRVTSSLKEGGFPMRRVSSLKEEVSLCAESLLLGYPGVYASLMLPRVPWCICLPYASLGYPAVYASLCLPRYPAVNASLCLPWCTTRYASLGVLPGMPPLVYCCHNLAYSAPWASGPLRTLTVCHKKRGKEPLLTALTGMTRRGGPVPTRRSGPRGPF